MIGTAGLQPFALITSIARTYVRPFIKMMGVNSLSTLRNNTHVPCITNPSRLTTIPVQYGMDLVALQMQNSAHNLTDSTMESPARYSRIWNVHMRVMCCIP